MEVFPSSYSSSSPHTTHDNNGQFSRREEIYLHDQKQIQKLTTAVLLSKHIDEMDNDGYTSPQTPLIRQNKKSNKIYSSRASIAIIGLVTFVGDSARGLIYPALWPLCQELGGDRVDLGWLIATLSIGRLVTSINLGILADIYRHRAILILSNTIMILGAILWATSSKTGGLPALYSGQFFMGVGTGKILLLL